MIRFFVFLSAVAFCFSSVPEPAISSDVISDFRWLGIGSEDRVGPNTINTANGVKDAQFQVVLDLPSPAEVGEIRVFVSDAAGNRGGEYWYSNNYGFAWILGVWHEGVFLNPIPGKFLGTFSGEVLFDLFANDSGRLSSYTHFLVEVDAAGQTYSRLASSGKPVLPLTRSDMKSLQGEHADRQRLENLAETGTVKLPDTVKDEISLGEITGGSPDEEVSPDGGTNSVPDGTPVPAPLGGLLGKYGFTTGSLSGGSGTGGLYKVEYSKGNIVGNYHVKSDHIAGLDAIKFFLCTKTDHGGAGDVIKGNLPAYRISFDGRNRLTIEISAGFTKDFWGERNMAGPFEHFTGFEKTASTDMTRYVFTTKSRVAFKVQEMTTTFESMRVVVTPVD